MPRGRVLVNWALYFLLTIVTRLLREIPPTAHGRETAWHLTETTIVMYIHGIYQFTLFFMLSFHLYYWYIEQLITFIARPPFAEMRTIGDSVLTNTVCRHGKHLDGASSDWFEATMSYTVLHLWQCHIHNLRVNYKAECATYSTTDKYWPTPSMGKLIADIDSVLATPLHTAVIVGVACAVLSAGVRGSPALQASVITVLQTEWCSLAWSEASPINSGTNTLIHRLAHSITIIGDVEVYVELMTHAHCAGIIQRFDPSRDNEVNIVRTRPLRLPTQAA